MWQQIGQRQRRKRSMLKKNGSQKVYPGAKKKEEEVDTVFKDKNMATSMIHQSCDCGLELHVQNANSMSGECTVQKVHNCFYILLHVHLKEYSCYMCTWKNILLILRSKINIKSRNKKKRCRDGMPKVCKQGTRDDTKVKVNIQSSIPTSFYTTVTTFLWIDATLKYNLTIRSSERNKCCPRIVATDSICGTHMQIIPDNGQRPTAWAVRVVQFISMADSRTGRLHILLMASNIHHCTAHMYLIQQSLMSAGFLKK